MPEDPAAFRDALTPLEFAAHWRFRSPESGAVLTLGDVAWPGQQRFLGEAGAIAAQGEPPLLVVPKARGTGISTAALCLAGWHLATAPNGRLHVVSKEGDSATDLLRRVREGLQWLPSGILHAPINRDVLDAIEVGEGEDQRVGVAYSTRAAGRSQHCTWLLIDEFQDVPDQEETWADVRPTIHWGATMIFTSRGPQQFAARFFQKAGKDEARWHPLFVSASEVTGRDPATPEGAQWWRDVESEMPTRLRKLEYPNNAREAFEVGSSLMFDPADIETAHEDTPGRSEPRPDRTYCIGVDLARSEAGDRSAFLVLDITEGVKDVVELVVLRGVHSVAQQRQLEQLHRRWNGAVLAVETNNMGRTLIENLDVPLKAVHAMDTTQRSKADRLNRVVRMVEREELRWSPDDFPDLDRELSAASWDDKHTSDLLMSLSFAVSHVEEARVEAAEKRSRGGRLIHLSSYAVDNLLDGGDRTRFRCADCRELRPPSDYPHGVRVCRSCLSPEELQEVEERARLARTRGRPRDHQGRSSV